MPVILDVDHQHQKTRVVANGEITLAEIRVHLAEEGSRSGLGYRELIDASQATATFNSEEARQIMDILKGLGRKGALGPTAIIVSNDVTLGMFRILEVFLEGVCELRAFRIADRDAAEEWLANATITPRKPIDNGNHA